jgi:hypothetical protein
MKGLVRARNNYNRGRISKRCGPYDLLDTPVTNPNDEPELPLREAGFAFLTLIVFLACMVLAAMPWM